MTKLWRWFVSLPWYGKVVAPVVLILLALFFVLMFVGKIFNGVGSTVSLAKLDKLVEAQTKANVVKSEEVIREETTKIYNKKKEIEQQIQKAENVDAETAKGIARIRAAQSMEELDKLQKEMGL